MKKIKGVDMMSVPEAAAWLGYTGANITKLIRGGKLRAEKRGRQYFLRPEDVENYAFVRESAKQFFS